MPIPYDLTLNELAIMRLAAETTIKAMGESCAPSAVYALRAAKQLQRLTERRCEKCQYWDEHGEWMSPPYIRVTCNLLHQPFAAHESCSRFTPKPTEAK